jgi:hypothetical protein
MEHNQQFRCKKSDFAQPRFMATEAKSTVRPWIAFAGLIGEHLTADDDPCLLQVAVDGIISHVELLLYPYRGRERVFVQIGSCPRWLSPHNGGDWFREDVKFAWPSGYGRNGTMIFGLPEFDWSLIWEWIGQANYGWLPVERAQGRRPLVLRVALPARTARHVRAVVHTVWVPGSPANPKEKLAQGYAFKKLTKRWRCVAKTTLL